MKISGGCHCGAVRFEAELPDPPIKALDCNCSVCRKTGFLHVIVPHDRFDLVTGREALSSYALAQERPSTCFAVIAGSRASTSQGRIQTHGA